MDFGTPARCDYCKYGNVYWKENTRPEDKKARKLEKVAKVTCDTFKSAEVPLTRFKKLTSCLWFEKKEDKANG